MNSTVRNVTLYALALCSQMGIYNLTGAVNSTNFQLQRNLEIPMALDLWIPFVPQGIWMYCFYYLILATGFVLAFDKKIFTHFFKNFIWMSVVADLIFVLIPVSVPRPELIFPAETSFTHLLLQFIYTMDSNSNCFPSLHCAHSFLITFWFWKSENYSVVFKYVLVFMSTSVVLATLLIKQHWFVDIVGAFILFILIARIYEKKFQYQRV